MTSYVAFMCTTLNVKQLEMGEVSNIYFFLGGGGIILGFVVWGVSKTNTRSWDKIGLTLSIKK